METDKSTVENQFKIFDNMLEDILVYKLVFNDKGEAIDGILKYMNHATVETLELYSDDSIGKRASELFGLDFIKPYLEATNEFLVTGRYNKFESYYSPTDKYFIISGFTMPGELFAVIATDITEQKKVEKELKESKRQVEEILESITDSFFSLDKNWAFTYVNQRAATNVGVKPENLIGKKLWDVFPESIGTIHESAYRKAMEKKGISAI